MTHTASIGTLPSPAEWHAIASRDRAADGSFVFGVTSTGIYCRPSCPARRPAPANVCIFESPAGARAGGFRACRRCDPDATLAPAAAAVTRARTWLDNHPEERLTLDALARVAGLSPSHLQRQFKALTGLSPAEYQRARRAGDLRTRLRHARNVTDAVYEAGYESPSRAYAETAAHLGMTPATYRTGGEGATIRFRVVPTALGQMLVAGTTRGLCKVAFGANASALESDLRREFPRAIITPDRGALTPWLRELRQRALGRPSGLELPLDVLATAFQWRVWRELAAVPYGATRSYGTLAAGLGLPRAARAVARACASNPTALAIPCHRAVRGDGTPGGYRWGPRRKRALLDREGAGAGGESRSPQV